MAVVVVVVVAPAAILLQHKFGGFWDLLGIVPGFVIALPLDKLLDEKCRHLKPLKSGDDKKI